MSGKQRESVVCGGILVLLRDGPQTAVQLSERMGGINPYIVREEYVASAIRRGLVRVRRKVKAESDFKGPWVNEYELTAKGTGR